MAAQRQIPGGVPGGVYLNEGASGGEFQTPGGLYLNAHDPATQDTAVTSVSARFSLGTVSLTGINIFAPVTGVPALSVSVNIVFIGGVLVSIPAGNFGLTAEVGGDVEIGIDLPVLSDLVWRPCALVSDSDPTLNGGEIGEGFILPNHLNNVFPDITEADRTTGGFKWRKVFIHLSDDFRVDQTIGVNMGTYAFLDNATEGEDSCAIVLGPIGYPPVTEDAVNGGYIYAMCVAGTLVELISQGEEMDPYGCLMKVRLPNIAAWLTLLDISDSSDTRMRISNKAVADGPGSSKIFTAYNSYPDWEIDGDEVTFGTDAPYADVNGIYWPGDKIAGTLELASYVGDFGGSYAYTEVYSAGGGWSGLGYYPAGFLKISNKGIKAGRWVLKYTSATEFELWHNGDSNDTELGEYTGINGLNTMEFAPNNPDTNAPYFTLYAEGWGGTWAEDDKLLIIINDASKMPLWLVRYVPPGMAQTAELTRVDVVIRSYEDGYYSWY